MFSSFKHYLLLLFFAHCHYHFLTSAQGIQPLCKETEFVLDRNKKFNAYVRISNIRPTPHNLLSCLSECWKRTNCDTILFYRPARSCILARFRYNTDQLNLRDHPGQIIGRKPGKPKTPYNYIVPGTARAGQEVYVRCRAYSSYPLVTRMEMFLNNVLYATSPKADFRVYFNATASHAGIWKCVAHNPFGQKYRTRWLTYVLQEDSGQEFHVAFGPILSTTPVSHHLVIQSAEYASVNVTSPRILPKTIFLTPQSSQQVPFTPADVQPANIVNSSVESMGIRIRSNASIKVFAYSFSQRESSASLVYPIHNLTQKYTVGSYPTIGMFSKPSSKSCLLVVASEPNTKVSIFQKRSSNCNPQTVLYKGATYGHGDYVNETLQNIGDVFYFVRYDCNINGWEVTASAPVAVFSGIEQVFTDSNASSLQGDPIYEQILPIEATGLTAVGPNLFSKPALYNTIIPGSYITYRKIPAVTFKKAYFTQTNFDNEFDAAPMEPNVTYVYPRWRGISYMFMRPFQSLNPSIGDPAMLTFLSGYHWPFSCHFGLPSFPSPDMTFRLFVVVNKKYAGGMLINGTKLATYSFTNTSHNVFDEEIAPGYYVIKHRSGTIRFFSGVYGTTRRSYPDNGFATICSYSLRLIL